MTNRYVPAESLRETREDRNFSLGMAVLFLVFGAVFTSIMGYVSVGFLEYWIGQLGKWGIYVLGPLLLFFAFLALVSAGVAWRKLIRLKKVRKEG